MDSLVHADIFFFVTTIAVVVVGILFVIALIYLIRLLHRAHEIAEQVRAEAVLVRGDIQNIRNHVQQGGSKLKLIGDIIAGIFKNKSKKK